MSAAKRLKQDAEKVTDALECLGTIGECPFELHVPKKATALHSNIVAFVRKSLPGRRIRLCPHGEGIYLLFPEDTPESRKALNAKGVEESRVEETLYGLCEPASIVASRHIIKYIETKKSLDVADEANTDLVAELNKKSPAEQLDFIWKAVEEASLRTIPCMYARNESWNAAKKLWGLPDECAFEEIVLGHAQCRLIERIEAVTAFPALMPMYVLNYKQDEQQHELHVIAVIVYEEDVLLMDPNGVPGEDFGEPNAVFLKLPFQLKSNKRRKR